MKEYISTIAEQVADVPDIGKIFDVYDTEHILSSFKFRIAVFHVLKMSLSIKYGFVLSILITLLEDYRANIFGHRSA